MLSATMMNTDVFLNISKTIRTRGRMIVITNNSYLHPILYKMIYNRVI
jgi:hypothetical protein